MSCPAQTDQIGPRMQRLSNTIKCTIGNKLATLDLTGSQSFLLHYLAQREDEIIHPRDIEKRFNLTHPTVLGILQRMEAKGFLVLSPDPKDRRCRRVNLTDKARACEQDVGTLIASIEQSLVRGMSPEEVDTFQRLLDRALQNLSAFTQKEDPST